MVIPMIYLFFIGIFIVILFILYGVIPTPLKVKVDTSKKKIACVGDSNTYGEMIFCRFLHHYPRVLQKLKPDYQVFNFGVSGTTAKIFSKKPYIKTFAFQNSLKIKPDIIILCLGSNDSKKKNWTSREDFFVEYEELLHHYFNLPNRPQIILATPMYPHDRKYGIQYIHFKDINESILTLGKKYNLSVIDFYSKTKKYIEYFSFDNVHLNRKGAQLVAQTICEFLTKS